LTHVNPRHVFLRCTATEPCSCCNALKALLGDSNVAARF
jgi:hypothetical protein